MKSAEMVKNAKKDEFLLAREVRRDFFCICTGNYVKNF